MASQRHVTADTTARVALFFIPLGLLAWLSGLPFVFPSLGPSAYVLAVAPDADTSRPSQVVGGHLIGIIAGVAAYQLLAPGVIITAQHAPGELATAQLAVSGLLAVTVTTGGMLATGYRHPPACATTLIVALGLLSTPQEAGIILLAVLVLLAVERAVQRLVAYPS